MIFKRNRRAPAARLAAVGMATLAVLLSTVAAPAADAAQGPAAPVAQVPPPDLALGSLPLQPLLHPPSSYDWYKTPATIPAGSKPGYILKAREVPFNPIVPDAGRTVQFMYVSTNAAGHLVPVTGTLIAPLHPNGKLVTLAHGTMGMGDYCAPSQGFNLDTLDPRNPDYEVLSYQQYLAHGDTIVISDYLGAGTPLPQEYLVGPSEAYNQLDAARAALYMPATGLGNHAAVGLSGYSQGGQTTAWSAQIAHSYAPELNVVGAVIDAPPLDMQAQYNQLRGNLTAGAGIGLAALQGIENAYHNVGIAKKTTAFGKQVMARVNNACIVEALGTFGTLTADMLSNPAMDQSPAVVADFKKSQLALSPPVVPAYIYQGSNDTIVPPSFGPHLFESWCSKPNVTAEFTQLPLQEHLSGNVTGTPQAIDWMQNRLDGQHLAAGCTRGGQVPGL